MFVKYTAYINLKEINIDGNGTNLDNIAKIVVAKEDLALWQVIETAKVAISACKEESGGEWQTDECLEAAKKAMEELGCVVNFIYPDAEIEF